MVMTCFYVKSRGAKKSGVANGFNQLGWSEDSSLVQL